MTTGIDPVPGPRTVARDFLDLELALFRARAVQWSPAPRAGGHGPSRHGSGGYSDPTADIATDRRRMEVSARVRHAEDMLRRLHDDLRAEVRHLDDAVRMWEGDD